MIQIMPRRGLNQVIWHSSRVVIHPDYVGIGLGLKFVNEVCQYFYDANRSIQIQTVSSNKPMISQQLKSGRWEMIGSSFDTNVRNKNIRSNTIRLKVKKYSFKFIPEDWRRKKRESIDSLE